LFLRINQRGKEVSAEWFNDSWNYRQRVDISNSSGSDLTDFQVSIDIGTSALIAAGKMQSDCDDIRITDQNGNLLPYWIEENNPGCNQVTDTKIWVKAPSLPTSGSPVYVYYGNSSATTVQNGEDVFEFFDDFNGSSIDTTKWTVTGTMLSLTGGRIRAERADGTGSIYANSTYSRPFVLDMDFYPTQYPSGWEGTYHGTIAFGTFNSSNQNEHTWVPYGGGGNSYCGLCDDGGCYHGTYVNPLRVGDTLYNISMKIQPTIAGPQGVMSYTNIPNDGIGSSVSNTVYTGATTGDDPLKIGINNYSSNTTDDFEWDNWRIRKYASSEPTATPASEEVGGGPVAYWKFDEGVGTTAYDSTSQNNTGIFLSAPIWKNEDMCVSGKCLMFDNVDDGVSITNNNFTTLSDYTMSAWINIKGAHKNYDGTIMSSGNWNSNHWSFGVNQANTAFKLRRWDGTNYNTKSYTFQLNQWTHVVIVRSGSNLTYYVNGNSIGSISGTTGNLISDATNTTIGRETYASGYFAFNGLIDEPKIFPYARTEAQIKADYAAGLAGMDTSSDSTVNIGGASAKFLSDGLVGYWKFDEGVGTTSVDSSGNNNLATLSNTGWSSGKFGIGTSFDGNSEVVYVPNSTSLQTPANNQWSMSAWVYPTDLSGSRDIVRKDGSGGGYFIRTNNGNIESLLNFTDGYVQRNSGTVDLNVWQLITVTYDGSTRKHYKNGVEVASWSENKTLTFNTSTITMGSATTSGTIENWIGTLDEVRIYNRALNPTEVKQLYEFAPGPMGYWKFEEGVGTTAFDSSGNNNHAIFGAGDSSPSWNIGKYGNGLLFDSTNDYLQITSTSGSTLNPKHAISVDAWVKFNETLSASYRPHIIGKNSSYFLIGETNQRPRFFIYDTTWRFAEGTSNLLPNKWYHLSGTYDGSMIRIYVNGKLENTVGPYGELNQNSSIIEIGRYGPTSSHFVGGIIDQVRIYNYARTQKQILEDMNAGAPATSARGGPLIYYKLDEGYGTNSTNWGIGSTTYRLNFGAGDSAPSWSSNGKIGKSLRFDGTNYGDPSSYYLAQFSDHTYTAWFNLDTSQASNTYEQPIFGSHQYSGVVDYIPSSKTFRHYRQYSTGGQTVSWPVSYQYADGKWHHLAMSIDQTTFTVKLYLDGKYIDTKSITNEGYTHSNGAFRHVGKNYGRFWTGYLDELKVFNYALSAEEVKQDYNQGSTFVFGTSNQTIGATTTSLDYCVPGDTSPCSPPVAEWKFEEGVGTTAYDTSGNNNHGIFGAGSSAPSWNNGKMGTAIYFDGTPGKHVTVSAGSGNSNNFTVQAWVKPTNYTGSGNNNDRNTILYANNKYLQLYSNGKIAVYINSLSSPGYHYSNATVPLNQWTHVAYNYNGSEIRIFINGSLDSSFPATGTPPDGWVNATIGFQDSSYQRQFDGSVDQVQIYNYARTPAQIAWSYNKGAPVGHWKVDECQGTQIADWSGNSNHGTLSIGASGTQTSAGTCTTSGTAWANGKLGKLNSSLNFDGSDDYFLISQPKIQTSPNYFTIAGFIKPGNLISRFITPNSTGLDQYFTYVNTSQRLAIHIAETNDTNERDRYSTTNSVPLNTWTHFAVSINDKDIKIYINGKLDSQYTETINISGWSGNWYIGQRGNSTNWFLGQLDDLRIYNYALTATQINTLYNNGSVTFR